MIDAVLQAIEFAFDVRTAQLVVLLAGIGVGTLVVYQALRGYRRNDSRAMLFLAIGLLLLGPVHFALALLPLGPFPVGAVSQLLDVLGLLGILYSLTGA